MLSTHDVVSILLQASTDILPAPYTIRRDIMRYIYFFSTDRVLVHLVISVYVK